ncbi:MAG: hypothetical protein Q8P56_01280 [Candidatus Uhrbacteria bacterium]|nr:hypothetical protein [Candidatus Uhrbacteria bacterium]
MNQANGARSSDIHFGGTDSVRIDFVETIHHGKEILAYECK